MAADSAGDLRRACLQQLQNDLFLGADSLPFDRGKVPSIAAESATDSISGEGAEEKRQALAELEEQVKACTQCPLAKTRTNVVFGCGRPAAQLVFVGKAPGYYEDQQGVPFVGRAGKLLDDIISKGMGLAREDVYICNILKCRPPQNRDPGSTEMVCCIPYLEKQLEIIAPEVICCLGRVAAQSLLQTKSAMRDLRGQWHEYRGVKTMVTYHPAYLLRNPADKKKTWADIQKIMVELGLEIPAKK